MTNPAELNAKRLTQQLEINKLKPIVSDLEAETGNGKSWNDISSDWNSAKSRVDTTRSTLQNLKGQNSGFKGQTGYVSTESQLTVNIVETNALGARLQTVQTTAYSNQNIIGVQNNITKNSAGEEVLNNQIGAIENSRFISPIIGNRQLLDDVTKEVTPVVASQNKPTNARVSTLSTTEDAQLGDVKGSGAESTVGGAIPVRNTVSTGAANLSQRIDDDATQKVNNSVGNASQTVEGRTEIAAEFLQTIVPTANPLAGLASQTYTISIYLMDKDEFKQFLFSDKKTLPTQQLLMSSGGAPIGQRNKYFDLDFYPENLEFKAMIGTQATGSPHNVVTMSFEVLEPQGITFLERLRQAVWDHTGDQSNTINAQNYLMVIRFFGYDEQGNLVTKQSKKQKTGTGSEEETSDPNALVEKFIPFQIANINYKIATEAVNYNIKCVIPQLNVGYSTARGTIPFNFQLAASDVQSLLNGDSELAPITPIVTTRATGGPPNQNTVVNDTITSEQQRAGKIGLKGRTVISGLADALNKHQQALCTGKNAFNFPDRYIIELEDVPGLKDAKMRMDGTVDKRRVDMQKSSDPNQKLNQKKQNFDADSRNYSVSAGTQIVQLIDQVMKNSTYVTAQQTIAFDEITNKEITNEAVKTVQWYKISQTATPIQWDDKRGDYNYEIKFKVSRYQINSPRSEYFPAAMYRGVHKLYEYWFTGKNTELLNFEIDVNTNYLQPIGNDGRNKSVKGNARFAEKKFFQASAEESTQGGTGQSTMPAAQLASRLYGPADVAKCDFEIVGDPDWITQSEVFYSTSNLAPFEPDGSVNTGSSEVLAEIRFNRVIDYDLATGLTPVFKNNMAQSNITGETNLAEEALVFNIIEVRNMFKAGKFTQTLKGVARDFDTAIDSPAQKKAEKNKIERTPKQIQEEKDVTQNISPRTSKLPVGSRGSGKFLDTRGTQSNATGTGGETRRPDYITGGTRPSGLKPDTTLTPYSSTTVNNETTAKIAKQVDKSINYTDETMDTTANNWLPPVKPKPGSNTVSDDAGSTVDPWASSLLAKKNRLARERSKARIDAGAKVVGNTGGGTRASDAFR
jgi:hypothetical protein